MLAEVSNGDFFFLKTIFFFTIIITKTTMCAHTCACVCVCVCDVRTSRPDMSHGGHVNDIVCTPREYIYRKTHDFRRADTADA